jgi:hypothetical protein
MKVFAIVSALGLGVAAAVGGLVLCESGCRLESPRTEAPATSAPLPCCAEESSASSQAAPVESSALSASAAAPCCESEATTPSLPASRGSEAARLTAEGSSCCPDEPVDLEQALRAD